MARAGAEIQMDELGNGYFSHSDTAPLIPPTDNTPLDTFTPPGATGGGDNVDVAETSFGGNNTDIDTYGKPIGLPDVPTSEPDMIPGDNLGNLRAELNYGTLEEGKIRVVDELFKSVKIHYGFDPPKKKPYDQFKVRKEQGVKNGGHLFQL